MYNNNNFTCNYYINLRLNKIYNKIYNAHIRQTRNRIEGILTMIIVQLLWYQNKYFTLSTIIMYK